MFSLIVTFYVTKTENKNKNFLTQLLTLLLSVKVLIKPQKNIDFLQKNADISKIKWASVLKGIFSETKYVRVLTSKIWRF